jgi:hypothetical protein
MPAILNTFSQLKDEWNKKRKKEKNKTREKEG